MRNRQYWQCTAFDFDELPWPELEEPLENLRDQEVAEFDGMKNIAISIF